MGLDIFAISVADHQIIQREPNQYSDYYGKGDDPEVHGFGSGALLGKALEQRHFSIASATAKASLILSGREFLRRAHSLIKSGARWSRASSTNMGSSGCAFA
jgi:hypothetical protein